MTVQQRQAFIGLLDGIQSTLAQAEHGMPLGHVYAAVMSKVSYDGFQKLIAILCATGRCYTEGELIFAHPLRTE